jgi:hypothetical protein
MAELRRGAGDRGWWKAINIAGPPVLVAAGAALVLRMLSAVPSLLQPCPSGGAGRWRDLARAEVDLGIQIWTPRELPAGVAWPPRRIECLAPAPLAVRMVMEAPGASGAVLELTQVLDVGPQRDAPSPFWPSTQEFPVKVNGGGTLRAERGPDGRTWHQVRWARGGRQFTLRAPLEAAELLRSARSIGPPAGRRDGS